MLEVMKKAQSAPPPPEGLSNTDFAFDVVDNCHPELDSGSINTDKSAPILTFPHKGKEIGNAPSPKKGGRKAALTLAEVFHPLRKSKKIAFTLAEVLITLGIIGVVAALTMPSLVSNYQKKVWVTQLKKDVSYVQNSVKMIFGQEGVDKIDATTLYTDSSWGDCMLNINNLNSYLKLQKAPLNSKFSNYIDRSAYYGEENYTGFTLNNGSCISFSGMSYGYSCSYAKEEGFNSFPIVVEVDVNCDKKPNEFGRDRFRFTIEDNGMLKTYGGICTDSEIDAFMQKENESVKNDYENAVASGDEYLIGEIENYLKNTLSDAKKKSASGCFAKIVRDGWQMKY